MILLLLGGCAREESPAIKSVDQMRLYGSLPGLQQTHFGPLQDELARIVSEEATPEQLTADPTHTASAGAEPTLPQLPDEKNVAAGVREAITVSTARLILSRSASIYPAGPFQFNPTTLELAIEVRGAFTKEHRRYRAAVARPQCDFRIDHVLGLGADLSFLEIIQAGNLLEALLAAELLAEDKPNEAIQPLTTMLRITELLAHERHLTTRLEVVLLRARAIRVLEAIAQHRSADARTHKALFQLLERQVNNWPPDADAWIGKRAEGMHTFEMIRDGQILSVLTEDEMEGLSAANQLEALTRAVAKTVNNDEMFFLRAMRELIANCEKPYYERKESLDKLRDEISRLEDLPDYPLVSAVILLPDFEAGHLMQGRDRALCEAWMLALAESSGIERPTFQNSPLTGELYRVERQERRVVVWGAEVNGEAVEIVAPIVADNRQE